jgi:phage-related protein
MKKKIVFDQRAYKDLLKFPLEVISAFDSALGILSDKGKLENPLGKKLGNNLFEIRIRLEGAWRGCYAYLHEHEVIILHVFRKKTQKTPQKEIETAKKRLRDHVYL